MKRSEVNNVIRKATVFFEGNGWVLPPNPKWDITDFGLGNFSHTGLTLINLAEEEEYCEKLMYASYKQITPAHKHNKKKEDIICRNGILIVQLWTNDPSAGEIHSELEVKINGEARGISSGTKITLMSGERITINKGVWHEFYPNSEECIIGEISTANDDLNDNFFSNKSIGRFSKILEDEPAIVNLLSDHYL